MTPEGGAWEDWMRALEELDRALPERARPPCPTADGRSCEPSTSVIPLPFPQFRETTYWLE
jgi:hypothetical protein